MKKAAMILTAAICAATFCTAACGETGNASPSDSPNGSPNGSPNDAPADSVYSVYTPDGAPALSLAYAISEGGDAFDYHVVDSATITTYVTGNAPAADFCILPLNAASKLLGTGETYQMLGTVTNGNLFFLTTEGEALTSDNLSSLVGKTVGVVQLANVPGLTLQVVLNQSSVAYQVVTSVDAQKAADKVNLLAVDATNVTPAYGCDYYLCPEPAATTKINGTASAPKPFRLAGNLQTLYGGEDGYPQAVLVAKKTVSAQAKGALIEKMQGAAEYLRTAAPAVVSGLLDGKRTEGLTPAFTEKNLNATVIANCSVRYVSARDGKDRVNAFLGKLIAVNPTAAKSVSDAFFYEG